MIARPGNGNFFVTHYDWIAAGVGLAALAGAVGFCLLGQTADEAMDEVVAAASTGKAEKSRVEAIDMTDYAFATNAALQVRRYESVSAKAAALFTSEARNVCTNCLKATPLAADEDGATICAFCKVVQKELKVKVDKGRNAWEKKYGISLAEKADDDADGDDFTNLEEYEAKTDPKDKDSHPDYLAGLSVQLPLRATSMPFVFIAANKIPTGWRCTFFDAKQKDDYGRAGKSLTALIGEEIGVSGFVLKAYEQKEATRKISGGQGMTKRVDVSEVTVVRKKDGREMKLVLAANKREKPATIDSQATLVYNRRGTKTFDVVPGSDLVLSKRKYRVLEIVPIEKNKKKGAKVVVQDVITGVKMSRDALEE